ncbi:dTMP kinase [Candidatus Bathyarchaeota archaeon]|nr:MAG: dTMP kinase [Candidatus Bathyarchaeota archaeon]RLI31489.1 MAG: dTMP kinase [Candidatus Bathyarchaeota archaeon]
MKGLFIVFEGIEGSGKTTHAKALKKWLEEKRAGYKVEFFKEPTSFPIGSLIKRVLNKEVVVAEEALPLLFAADRADHTIRHITPALEKGSIVICDRYVFSSLAYQGGGMKVKFDIKWLKEINKFIIEPDIVFFLDVPPEEGLKRISRVNDDRYFYDLEVQKRIRETYYNVLNLNWPISDSYLIKRYSMPRKLVSKVRVSLLNNTWVVKIDSTLPHKENQKIIKDFVNWLIKSKNIGVKEEKKEKYKKLSQILNSLKDKK